MSLVNFFGGYGTGWYVDDELVGLSIEPDDGEGSTREGCGVGVGIVIGEP